MCCYVHCQSFLSMYYLWYYIVVIILPNIIILTLLYVVSAAKRYFAKKFLQLHKVFVKVREHLFARNVATNFKLHVWMDCVIIYYVTHTQIANLLRKSPVREPVHEPFHAPRVSSWFIRFHASQIYALTYVCTCKRREAHGSQTNSWGMNWFVNWLMTWFMNWWVMKWLRFMCLIAFYKIN